MSVYGRITPLLTLLLGAFGPLPVPVALPADEYFEEAPLRPPAELGFVLKHGRRIPSRGQVSVLTVFAQFPDDEPNDVALPEYAFDLFDPALPGSFTHFYHTLSLGQLQIHATVLPKRYTSHRSAAAYPPTRTQEETEVPVTGFGRFALEILRQVDDDYDLGRFDNDGPDGRPNSGDDDGYVDFVFIILRRRPPDFLFRAADGVVTLGFQEPYTSADTSASGGSIGIRGGFYLGTVLLGKGYARTVGVMAHEFGHALGTEPLPDLYDRSHQLDPDQPAAAYSAGIGGWGLMGQGTLGWQRDGRVDGPNPFCAWSLEQLGWISAANGRLVPIRSDTTGVRLADLYRGGILYKIPLRTPVLRSSVLPAEYLLLEYRGRATHYHRHDPGEGLLVWHVRSSLRHGSQNNLEENKLVDLVCADGLFRDAGYDTGRDSAPHQGYDNLDFWTPDRQQSYREAHRGNSGDSTDLFDGTRFTRLDARSNPSSLFGDDQPPAYTGPAIRLVERQDGALVVDIDRPRWAGTIRSSVQWAGDILVDGDLTVAPEGEVVVYPTARVRVAGRDRLQGGLDPSLVEIHLQGGLRLVGQGVRLISSRRFEAVQADSFVFEPAVPGDRWYGIVTDEPLDPRLVLRATGPVPTQDALGIPTAVLEEATPTAPDTFSLGLNYPNPFSRETTLPYTLPRGGPVQLDIYNALGQPVRRLVDEYREAGAHRAVWDGLDEAAQRVASGVYLYRLEAGGGWAAHRKMLFLPAGFARLPDLDRWLQSQEVDGSGLPAELAGATEQTIGFTLDLDAERAAYQIGRLWTDLQVLDRYGADPTALRSAIGRFGPLLEPFDPAARRTVEVLLAPLSPGDAQRLVELGRVLEHLARTHGEVAGLYFHLGTWLQSLRAATLAARRRAAPLGDILDLGADAATARHFADALRQAGAAENPATSLVALARRLEADPHTLRELGAVLDAVARFEEGMGP